MSGTPTEPDIVAETRAGDTVRLDIRVPADLLYFQGHFPDYPVLPGIVQTHWAVTCARRSFATGAATVSGVQVKFKHVIVPEQRVQLALTYARDRGRLSFEYSDGTTVFSSGVITLTGA